MTKRSNAEPDLAGDVGDSLGSLLQQSTRLVSTAVAGWARVADRTLRATLALWKIPVDLIYAEDDTLGVCCTSVNVPDSVTDPLAPRCTSARLVQGAGRAGLAATAVIGGVDVASGVRIDPIAHAVSKSGARQLLVTLPNNAPAGLYELTFVNDASGQTWNYLHPFGVPRRLR